MEDEAGDKKLQSMVEKKDLGVWVRSDLKPSRPTQCVQVAARARRIIGMTKRNVRRLDKQDFLINYKTYIRPHLEYCVQAWSPNLTEDVEVLQKFQRAAIKLVLGLRKLEYN